MPRVQAFRTAAGLRGINVVLTVTAFYVCVFFVAYSVSHYQLSVPIDLLVVRGLAGTTT